MWGTLLSPSLASSFGKAKMGLEGIDYYMPVMVMVLIQLIYAFMSIGTRAVLLQGMSPRVFAVYRQAFATVAIAPIAYFSGYSLNSTTHTIRHLLPFLLTLSFTSSSCHVMSCLYMCLFLFLSFDRRSSASYSLNLRSFSLIFLTSLIGFV